MAGETAVEGRAEGLDAGAPCGVGSSAGPVVAFREWLATVDVAAMSDSERVALVGELERVKGSASAAQARAADAVRVGREVSAPRDVGRSVACEVALARREPAAVGDRLVGLARALVHEMPVTMAALTAGECSERVAVEVVKATACLSVADRAEVDARVGPLLGRLGVRGAAGAAGRVAAELDAGSVVARMEAAVRSRRVSVRPAPDGMAYLSVLGPLREVVGAHAAVQARARAVAAGQCEEEGPQGRGVGAVAADTALRVLSGRVVGQVQPVEVHLVVTDRTLLGSGDRSRPVQEPGRVPGHGFVPAPVARAWVRGDGPGAGQRPGNAEPPGAAAAVGAGSDPGGTGQDDRGSVWLRRVYTSPGGRDLVAMDSRRRVFPALLRRMLVLRDDVCATPWCDAAVVHADHAHPARRGGATDLGNGSGLCARCNQVKEAPGWDVTVIHPGTDPSGGPPREIEVTTPSGHRYRSQAPPLTGWGWQPPPDSAEAVAAPPTGEPASVLELHLEELLAGVA